MSQSWQWGDLDFASEVGAAVRRGPHPLTRLFLLTIALVFGGAIFWASQATLDEVTRGEGRVIPSTQLQVVQSLEGGIVKEIMVAEGDIVDPDQVLVRIDDTRAAASLGELEVQRRHLSLTIARLEAEANGSDSFHMPIRPASVTDEMLANESELFEARRRQLETERSILEQQIEQRRRELSELELQEQSFTSSLGLARQELSIYLPLAQTGVVPRVEVLRLQREVNDLSGELETTQNAIPRAQAAIDEATQRLEEVDLRFRSDARIELNRVRAELSVIEETMRGATDRVVRTDVRSPVSGIVNTVHVNTVGGVVQPGEALVEIVPIEDSLLVEARIRPSDVAFLHPGQTATVKITAYDFSIYGGLDGRIERISADTTTDDQTGESFYRVIVRTDQNFLGNERNPLPIIPGMVASVDILTGEKTVLEYILKPIIKAQTEALRER